jgi:hypothetical protein
MNASQGRKGRKGRQRANAGLVAAFRPGPGQQRLLPFCHIARQSAVATARVTRKPMLQCTTEGATFTNR